MKKAILGFSISALAVLCSCSAEKAEDCFQKAGTAVSKKIPVPDFEKINIGEGIELAIKQGPQAGLTVEAGKNVIEGITAEVSGRQLFIRNTSGCSWTKDYNAAKAYVTVPSLTAIYSSSQFAVKSEGVLAFPILSLQSGMFGSTPSGTFELQVDCQSLAVEDNESSFFKISGSTGQLLVAFYNGNARFDGTALNAGEVHVFQRSSNDIIVKPADKISGTIYSTGNVVLKNTPPVVNVVQLYQGHLVYP
ncbi:MAG TPA: head GIN domain-containing protein [Flavobacterium sp.]|nr:head GIN domain-containing protein [Flavobacterium sp.]